MLVLQTGVLLLSFHQLQDLQGLLPPTTAALTLRWVLLRRRIPKLHTIRPASELS